MANIRPKEKRVAIISALTEGNRIRNVERMTGVHRDSIMRLGARKAHAWSFEEDGKNKTTAVLEIPPVDGPQTAVKVAIAAKARRKA